MPTVTMENFDLDGTPVETFYELYHTYCFDLQSTLSRQQKLGGEVAA